MMLTHSQIRRRARASAAAGAALALAALSTAPRPAASQSLTLAEALLRAESASERIAIAEAGVLRAGGERRRAVSQLLPQLFASAGYTRTLDSEFQDVGFGGDGDGGGDGSADCGEFTPDPALPLEQRVDSLESAVRCASTASPFAGFSDLPFGRENQYNLGLSLSQTLWAGGRLRAQVRVADAARVAAELELASARAQLAFEVAQAYYDAMLADRLLAVAQATLTQAETTLTQVRLARDVGRQPEFEALRAQVTFETQRPVVIQRTADRDLAYLRLKQLLDLPADADVELTTDLDADELVPIETVLARLLPPVDALPGELESADTTAARVPVRQAAQAVRAQQNLLAVTRAQRLPSISLSSQYGRVAYPSSGLPGWSEFRTNWTISASLQVPVFTGGRIRGEEMIARADVAQSEAQFALTRELAALDTRDAVERLEAAHAGWVASAGTVEQATRAYSIAQVRFEEGISTQLELNDSRLLLQQASANRAIAARDLQIARLRVTLLPYLPIGSAGAVAGAGMAGTGAAGGTAGSFGGAAGQRADDAGSGSAGASGLPSGVRASAQGGG